MRARTQAEVQEATVAEASRESGQEAARVPGGAGETVGRPSLVDVRTAPAHPARPAAVSGEAGTVTPAASATVDGTPRTSGQEGGSGETTPRMWRRRSDRVVAGVAGGLADHLGIPVLWVRLAFTLLVGLSGAGVLVYGLLWAFVPQEAGDPSDTARSGRSMREHQQGMGLLLLGLGLAMASSMISGVFGGWITGPLGVALVGAAVVWREADEAQRRRWRDSARSGVTGVFLGGGGTVALVRVLGGILLVAAGIAVFLLGKIELSDVQFALLAVVCTLVGVAVLTVPWWVRLVRDLNEERRARIRTEERAEIAAHLHDSVLQTLALIQKQPDAPREVKRLARSQERQLRQWLYGPSGYGASRERSAKESSASLTGADPVGTVFAVQAGDRLSTAVAGVCAEVEDTFAITVQQVVVGDCELDEPLVATVLAAREAVVNAAKHAGVSEVSVYAEVESDRVEVYVRDRGKGFDPDTVPEDRHGLADSIHGRMRRHGGRVRVRTAPGEGTEIQLAMPRNGTARSTTGEARR